MLLLPSCGERTYGSILLDGDVRAGDWVVLDVTELVRGWQDGRWPNYGIGVAAMGATEQTVVFAAHETPYWGPYLRLIYATPPPTPTATPTATPQEIYLPLLLRR